MEPPRRGDIKLSRNGRRRKYDGKRWITLCIIEDCNYAQKRDKMCRGHGNESKIIETEIPEKGDIKLSRRGGRRRRWNGSKWVTLCMRENCDNQTMGKGVCRLHGAGRKDCIVEGCTRERRKDGMCWKHSNSKKNYCSVEGCTSTSSMNKLCCKHGGRRLCTVDGCTSSDAGKGLCRKHGAPKPICSRESCDRVVHIGGQCLKHSGIIAKRCMKPKCNKKAINKGLCRAHGAPIAMCSEKDCGNVAQRDGVCKRHGAIIIVPKCTIEDCDNQCVRGKKCIAHMDIDVEMVEKVKQRGRRHYKHNGKTWSRCCNNCALWPDSRIATKDYDWYCARCFKHLFPDDPRSIVSYHNTKELNVKLFLAKEFDGFIHDKPLWTNNCKCVHRRRIDFRKVVKNTLLCIEVDEFQHRRYETDYEEIRYNDIGMVWGGKTIFIRYNPDSYRIKGKFKTTLHDERMERLKKEIIHQTERINRNENEFHEIHYLYYNE